MAKHTVSMDFNGREVSLETGRIAKFANGSVMVRCGDTMVLVTAVASDHEKLDIDYLPLQVEYREKAFAAGKFPGGFLKREMRPGDHEILSARLIDRPIRPLIPKTWRFETQVIANVMSFDPDVDPDVFGAVGASAALLLSDIPFAGPISEVRVGRIDGELIINPSYEQLKVSDIDLTVSGTDTSLNMVEGESKEISEDEFLEAIEFAHENIRKLNKLQMELKELAGKEKREFTEIEPPVELVEFIEKLISDDLNKYVHAVTTKNERKEARNTIFDNAMEKVIEEFAEKEEYLDVDIEAFTSEIVGKLEKREMRKMILAEGKRLDGRALTEVRPITCEVGVLPRPHGSSLFTRGETQSLATITLGTKHDEQMVDGLLPTYTHPFMLHYNFPPFSTGEVKRMGLSRREIGHGNLAERALKEVIPAKDEFPYTIRVVSDIMESNGSSSMASVCAGSLALFHAGIPVKGAVSGIAMGLIKEGDDVAILSDILGDEDFLGDMDFKVAGTKDGITACQMDIKIEGLSMEIMTKALQQAHEGRMHILGKMNEAMDKPNDDLSQYAPRFTSMKVPQESIGAIIGSGGETIRNIVAESGAEVNIEEDGTVLISAVDGSSSEKAKEMINLILQKPEEGEVYTGVVKEVREGLGAIVEFLPKHQGLLHISQIAYERTENVGDVLEVGQEIEIKLLEISRDGKYRLSLKALLPKPEGYVEPERPPRRFNPRDRDNRRDNRRPGGGNRRDSRDSRDNRRR